MRMNAKQFLSLICGQIPLQLAPGVNCVSSKYSCAAVACILRRIQSSQRSLNDSEAKFQTLKELEESFDEKDNIEILFIKRTKRGGDRWSGDVAFPGGFLDVNESDIQGVTREVSEELGLDLADTTKYHWLGRLKHIDLGQSRTITPHLFFYLGSDGPLLKPEESEVAGVEWVNIRVFLDKRDLDSKVVQVGELYSRSQGEKYPGLWLFSTIAAAINCSSVYFPAVKLPIFGNYESSDHINSYRFDPSALSVAPKHWVLWGMTFKFISDLFNVGKTNQPFFRSKLPFWFDNRQVNMSMRFWLRVLSFRSRGVSRVPLIIISFSSLFGLYGVSLYTLWSGCFSGFS
jgi:8-oxo-dGTP pyrophosphatase MutT (NUDIX family)